MTSTLSTSTKVRLFITKARVYTKGILSALGTIGTGITAELAIINPDTTTAHDLTVAAAIIPAITTILVIALKNTTQEQLGEAQAVLENDASNNFVAWTPTGVQTVNVDGLAADQNGGDGTPYETGATS